MLAVHLATFKVDATPPVGHPLCGGWIKPVAAVDDPLWLRGVILQGAGLPIVLAALDWTGVLNESHRLWTEALADAARTTPDRVALHCVHQHNAPFIDRAGNALLKQVGSATPMFSDAFVDAVVARSAAEVRAQADRGQPVDRIRVGRSDVAEVASNRRIIGPDGKIQYTRLSAAKDPKIRAAPIGTIDPTLRSIGFFRGDRPLARLYYYTTHPMSFYGDGRVTSDFVGLARQRRDRDEPDTHHVYFTGAAGNVTAGKYNDGSPAARVALTDRVHTAMRAADADGSPGPLESATWTTAPIRFTPREDLDPAAIRAIVADPARKVADRNRSAMTVGWLERTATGRPILLGKLDLGGCTLLHLPAETFVEYQLEAQQVRPDRPLAVAAYGDGGPWYIPIARSYAEGGYEPGVSFVSPSTEPSYKAAIATLLRQG